MRIYKIACLILGTALLCSSCTSFPESKKSTAKTTKSVPPKISKPKTSKAREEKKPEIPEVIEKSEQYAIIHYVGMEEAAAYKKELFGQELSRINSSKKESDKVDVISLLHTQDKYSLMFSSFLNKFNKYKYESNAEAMITSEAEELAGKILLMREKKISIITYGSENFYLGGALVYLKKNYTNLDNFNITVCAVNSPITIENYTKEFKNVRYNYYTVKNNMLKKGR